MDITQQRECYFQSEFYRSIKSILQSLESEFVLSRINGTADYYHKIDMIAKSLDIDSEEWDRLNLYNS